MSKQYFVYILSSRNKALYIGMTNNLERRVWQHKNGQGSSHTKKYNINQLVYFEATSDVKSAISREKVLKGWKRDKKLELIRDFNPDWKDLSSDWLI